MSIFFIYCVNSSQVTANEPWISCASDKIQVDPEFEENKEKIIKMVLLSYHMVNCNLLETSRLWDKIATEQEFDSWCKEKIEIQNDLNEYGWEFHVFGGYSGIGHKNEEKEIDLPGFIAIHKIKNIVVIVFHGSRSESDWVTNFLRPEELDENESIENVTEKLGFSKDAYIHTGYALKYYHMKQSLYTMLKFLIKKGDLDIDDLTWYVTGHSQGAGLASLAMVDIANNFLPQYEGANFLNSEANKVRGWVISPPQVCGNILCVEEAEAIMGRQNIVRSQVNLDPVTMVPAHVSSDKATKVYAKLINKKTNNSWAIGNDFTSQAMMGLSMLTKDWLNSGVKYKGVKGSFDYYTLGLPAFQDAKKIIKTTKHSQQQSNFYQLFKKIMYTNLAPYHFCSISKQGGWWFDSDLIELDLTKSMKYSMKIFNQNSCEDFLKFNNR
tara:strand:+ start:973 stop:2289 length:1317 start_codon:yes stop_codon:yes gene_type:complete